MKSITILLLFIAIIVSCHAASLSIDKDTDVMAIVKIDMVSKIDSGVFENGGDATGLFAPGITVDCKHGSIDTVRMIKALFPAENLEPGNENELVMISSENRSNGDYTYYRSSSVRFFEFVSVKIAADTLPVCIVLVNDFIPLKIIGHSDKARWRIALFDANTKLVSQVSFFTPVRCKTEGIYDVISTFCGIEENHIVVRITYGHSGGGGSRDQGFTATAAVVGKKRQLECLNVKQTVDLYNEPESDDK